MKVELIDYTGAGQSHPGDYAAGVLLFTKNTRLEMSGAGLAEVLAMPYALKIEQLAYMANTIPSSWEFVDYTFMITGVTRAFTHQLVRTRTASFAQQTMRVLDVAGWTYGTGPTVSEDPGREAIYNRAMSSVDDAYRTLIDAGAAIEDARGVLPTNIHTNIVMKCNMRTFVEMVRKRSSPRTQGEYRQFLDLATAAVRREHHWIDLFIERTFDRAAKDLDQRIAAAKGLSSEERIAMIKLIDQMRAQS